MKQIKSIPGILLAVVIITLLAACGNSSSKSEESNITTESPTLSEPGDKSDREAEKTRASDNVEPSDKKYSETAVETTKNVEKERDILVVYFSRTGEQYDVGVIDEGNVPDLTQYSTVFIGSPVWWGDWPMILYTFFENEDLSGKTIYPFNTNAGSGLSGFDKKLSDEVPDATVGEGLAILGKDCQNDKDLVRREVYDWLSGLGY